MNYNEKAIELHKKYRGKIEIKSKVPLENKEDLSLAYTPGVAAVCKEIEKNPELSWEMTNRKNMVAIVTDGSAILGLGNIGPEAGMPVMEGKSAIFKEFANIDAIPLCINTTDTEEIIKFCKYIEPSFGGINLEDISAPRCFEILKRLEDELSIPVFRDDQDGTAIVVLAGLINACKITNKNIKELKIVINGAGAAGIAIARLLVEYGNRNIVLVDSKGVVCENRDDLNAAKKEMCSIINPEKLSGALKDALKKADVFIGVSKEGLLNKELVKSMNNDPIIFAMANPVPEIMPDEAKEAGAIIVGTGRSDFPNQINNALVFPGIFKGLLSARIREVTMEMKIKAGEALASVVKELDKDKILPNITDKNVVEAISKSIISSS